ncbi:MAG: PBP1A family penicillin-binding protein [Gemmatimonadetes bacterium]|nr:PBP1A family penicillin-binding protein [Gemmatimonadota bacterium]
MVSPVKPLIALWRKPGTRRTAGFGVLAMFGLGLGVSFGSWTRACAGTSCPSIGYLETYQPEQAAKFYAADGRLIQDMGISRTVVALEEMSPAIPAAFLASEDRRFFQHPGVDMRGFLRQFRNLALGRRLQGGSTITMQLARNVYTDQLPMEERSVQRKLREIQVALELERTYPKERILELYLNQIFLGGRANGVEEAARRYFGKSAAEVNVAEAATLAGIAPFPNAREPRRFPRQALVHRNTVLNLMRDQGYLTPEDAERWKAFPLEVSTREDFLGYAEYFVEWVRKKLYARFGDELFARGYRVYTTLDLDMQRSAERALEDRLREIESGNRRPDRPIQDFPHITYQEYRDSLGGRPSERSETPYLQGALVTIEAQNGYVRAMIGGRNYSESKWNRATQSDRQAGSTFKPFVYSAAIRAGRPASHIIVDEPISIFQPTTGQPWEPRNFEGDYRGPMSLRHGLRTSRNLIAIQLGREIGVNTVVGEALRFKLSTTIPAVPSVSIGAATVYTLEMVSAYSAFATLGVHAAPLGILRVEDGEGNIVWEPQVRTERVMDEEHAWIMNSMLQDVVNSGVGTAYGAVRNRGRFPWRIPAAGKTGTTNDGTDVWFMGFTPEFVTGVWMGFDRPQRIMDNATGGGLAAPVWATYMNEVYSRRAAPEPWKRPETLITRQVDKFTGYLATRVCPPQERYQEWFIPGTEPTEYCPYHPDPFQFGISSAVDAANPPGGWGAQRHHDHGQDP